MSTPDDADRDDEELLRTRYRELLEEFRTILPGVQVILAFLLTAPFATRFVELEPFGRKLYGIAVSAAALATILLMAPTSYHRLTRLSQEGRVDRERRIVFAARMALFGMAALAISVAAALLLVTNFVFDLSVGVSITAMIALVCVITWYAVPLVQRPKNKP